VIEAKMYIYLAF